MPYFVTIQGVKFETYQSSGVADESLGNLVRGMQINANDPSRAFLRSFVRDYLDAGAVDEVRKLVLDFFKKGTSKIDFKAAWRKLNQFTDEYISTQSVYIILDTIRKFGLIGSKIDLETLLDIMALFSHFRTRTRDSGHRTLQAHIYQHPAAAGSSLFVAAGNPTHSHFDLARRFLVFRQGQDYYERNPLDGVGAFLAMMIEANRITIGFNGNPFSSDIVALQGITTQRMDETTRAREILKWYAHILQNGQQPTTNTLRIQQVTNPQFGNASSPFAAIVAGRRLSNPRIDPLTLNLPPMQTSIFSSSLIPLSNFSSGSSFSASSSSSSSFSSSSSSSFSSSSFFGSNSNSSLSPSSNSFSNSNSISNPSLSLSPNSMAIPSSMATPSISFSSNSTSSAAASQSLGPSGKKRSLSSRNNSIAQKLKLSDTGPATTGQPTMSSLDTISPQSVALASTAAQLAVIATIASVAK